MEHAFVQWLTSQRVVRPDLLLGIGDDAAVWQADPLGQAVITTDLICDGTHFELARHDPRLIGRKALAVNLSDIAAMAAVPRVAVVSVAWPRELPLETAQTIYRGMFELALEFDVAVVGGDTNRWDGPLALSVTLIGAATDRGVLTRSGAQVGDTIVVTGPLGGSRLTHQFTFRPRVREAIRLHASLRLHAGMDISDGLALDLSRLIAASDVGAELDLAAIPIRPAAEELARTSGRTPLEHALGDGEDFELLLTLAEDEWQRYGTSEVQNIPLIPVGRIVDEPGLWSRNQQGERVALPPVGYTHE